MSRMRSVAAGLLVITRYRGPRGFTGPVTQIHSQADAGPGPTHPDKAPPTLTRPLPPWPGPAHPDQARAGRAQSC